MIWPLYEAAQYQSKTGNSSIYLSLFAYEGTFSMTFSSGISIHYGASVHYGSINVSKLRSRLRESDSLIRRHVDRHENSFQVSPMVTT